MLPPYILFDLDDTLFDHTHASRAALTHMHASHMADIAFETFVDEHARLLELHHHRFLSGELTMDEARAARMASLFARFDKSVSESASLNIAAQYRRDHQANRKLVDGARELLDVLAGKSRMGLITNNSVAEQMEKLRTLDIGRYFDTLVMSEDVGIAKPDKRIFDIALERMGAAAHETVMIGDSFSADIEGALGAGISAVWFNRKNHKTPLLVGSLGHIVPKVSANRGVLNRHYNEIYSLAPIDATLNAIQKIYQHSLATKEALHAKPPNTSTLAL
jgi:YjjG family noncanonical pyrimidine nucleotidase